MPAGRAWLAPLNVAVVACGDGARCRLWAARGHRVFGADHDRDAILRARARAFEAQLEILFDLADGAALPWPDRCMDLCLGPALPGCAGDWRACLDEMARVLRPGATLLLGSGPGMRRFVRRD